MKRLIQKVCFVYGCLAFSLSVLWFLGASVVANAIPDEPEVAISILAVHALFLCLTFQRFIGVGPYWTPIWRVSEPVLGWARRGILLVFVIFVCSVLFVFIAIFLHNETLSLRGFGLVLASMGMLSSTYIALHWAFRPENLFNDGLLKFVTDPVSYLRQGKE